MAHIHLPFLSCLPLLACLFASIIIITITIRYTRRQFMLMEAEVLRALRYNIALVTPLHLLRHLCEVADSDTVEERLACFLYVRCHCHIEERKKETKKRSMECIIIPTMVISASIDCTAFILFGLTVQSINQSSRGN